MRDPYTETEFDAVFNLFTSFGYFETMDDNLKVLQAVHQVLKDQGSFVLDYLNPGSLGHVPSDINLKIIDGVEYQTRKSLTKTKILKDILIKEDGEELSFQESVQLIDIELFRGLFEKAGFEINEVFGDYGLEPFHPESSPRIIIVAQKQA